MCGIAGGWSERPDPERLARALDAMVHRGPDSEGSFVGSRGFLGARRLAILDPERGAQPVFNEDRSVAAVLNGEIYNFEALRRELRGHALSTGCDTEILPHLWEEHGPGMLSRLRGMFALAILDTRRGELVLARDRLGKKPLYYRRDGPSLRFASELRGLRPLLEEAPAVSTAAVLDYLSFGFVPGAIWEGVDVLPPASWLRFDGASLKIERYWTPPPFEGETSPEDARRAISEAVAIRLRSDVPLGLFLSGGIDSTILAAELAKAAPGTPAFTLSFPEGVDETPTAARTAAAFGLKHVVVPGPGAREGLEEVVRAFDQPFADPSAGPTLALAREARRHVKVALTGDGGDELFAGYRRHVAARLLDASPGWLSGALKSVTPRARGRTPLGFASRFAEGVGVPFPTRYARWTSGLRDPERTPAELEGVDGRSELERFLNADLTFFLPGDLLVKMDRATMWHGLEARSPFLDVDVLAAARRVPPAKLLTRFRTKAWLRRLYADVLPAEVRRGSKKGFEPPLEAWMAGPLRPLADDVLGSPGSKVWTYVDRSLAAGASPKLRYTLLALELWLRRTPA